MKFWKERRAKRKAKREQDRLQQALLDGFDSDNLCETLPVNYSEWGEFWDTAKLFNDDYVIVPQCIKIGGLNVLVYDTNNTPVAMTYSTGYIRRMAINEAIEQEDYNRAAKIKSE